MSPRFTNFKLKNFLAKCFPILPLICIFCTLNERLLGPRAVPSIRGMHIFCCITCCVQNFDISISSLLTYLKNLLSLLSISKHVLFLKFFLKLTINYIFFNEHFSVLKRVGIALNICNVNSTFFLNVADVVRQKLTDVSEECTTSLFNVTLFVAY
jgi:hypothetical protein